MMTRELIALFALQISIMQMAGLKTRLEKALKTDETPADDNVRSEL